MERSYKLRYFFKVMSRHAQSASKLCFKELSYRAAFLLIIIVIIIVIIIIIYLTSVIIHINDETNYKSHSLKLVLFTPN